ncbi:MAG: hypothetical protein ACM3XM_05835, partial [Mycobacterium leprae]
SGAVLLVGLVRAFILALFYDTTGRMEWPYVVQMLTVVAALLPALTGSILAFTAAHRRGEVFFLHAGRTTYYLAAYCTGVLAALVWMGLMIGALALARPVDAAAVNWALFAAAAGLNALLAAGLATLFSPLCGGNREVVIGLILLILGLNGSWAERLSVPWLRSFGFLAPPLLANIHAVGGQAALRPGALQSLIYLAVLLGLGILRFARREFART